MAIDKEGMKVAGACAVLCGFLLVSIIAVGSKVAQQEPDPLPEMIAGAIVVKTSETHICGKEVFFDTPEGEVYGEMIYIAVKCDPGDRVID